MAAMKAVVGIDVGGTKIACGLFLSSGEVLFEKTEPTGRGSADVTVAQIAGLAHEAVARTPGGVAVGAIGIVVPGWVDRTRRTVWAPNVEGWDHIPLERLLREQVPLPVVLDSDRSGCVKGEAWLGAARGLTDVVFLAVGTGIGAGIIADGSLLHGHDDLAGAVGWMALNPEFQERYRSVGCFEAEAAGASVAFKAAQRLPRRRPHEAPWSASQVFRAALGGGSEASELARETALYLGMGIANLVSVLNPQMVVLGGGLFHHGTLLLKSVQDEVGRWAQPFAAERVRIELSSLGTRAGLTGAARIALDNM